MDLEGLVHVLIHFSFIFGGSKTNESRYLSGSRMLNMWFIFRFLLSFLFLAQVGPDGLGPPNNRTQLSCSADASLMFDVPKRDRMSLITLSLQDSVYLHTWGTDAEREDTPLDCISVNDSLASRKTVENMLQIPANTESCKSCDSSISSVAACIQKYVLCLFLPSDELCRASQVLVGLRLQLPDSHLLGQSMLDVQKWLPPLHLGKEVEQINGSMMICLKGLMRKQSHRFLPCIFMYQGWTPSIKWQCTYTILRSAVLPKDLEDSKICYDLLWLTMMCWSLLVGSTEILSDAETDGLGIASQAGLHAADCSFWQRSGTLINPLIIGTRPGKLT